jgi:hypothetical protein
MRDAGDEVGVGLAIGCRRLRLVLIAEDPGGADAKAGVIRVELEGFGGRSFSFVPASCRQQEVGAAAECHA